MADELDHLAYLARRRVVFRLLYVSECLPLPVVIRGRYMQRGFELRQFRLDGLDLLLGEHLDVRRAEVGGCPISNVDGASLDAADVKLLVDHCDVSPSEQVKRARVELPEFHVYGG